MLKFSTSNDSGYWFPDTDSWWLVTAYTKIKGLWIGSLKVKAEPLNP